MKKLLSNIANLQPIYHITGEDLLVIEQAIDAIKEACNNGLGDINESYFDGENFDAVEIINSCQQLPMMADKRFVLVKNVEKVLEGSLKTLLDYSANPNTSSVLVLCEIPGLNVFGKIKAEKVVCNKLTENELFLKINEKLAQNGKKIEKNACFSLISMCKRDSLLIEHELFKLIYADFESQIITEDDVFKMVNIPEEHSIFVLTDALNKGDVDLSLKLIKQVLESSSFVVVLGLIANFYRRMFFAVTSGKTTEELAKIFGVKEFAIKKAKNAAKILKPMQILKINQLILDVDYSIKSGKLNNENAMYYLVFAINQIIKGEK